MNVMNNGALILFEPTFSPYAPITSSFFTDAIKRDIGTSSIIFLNSKHSCIPDWVVSFFMCIGTKEMRTILCRNLI
jgi:hypothetical protein